MNTSMYVSKNEIPYRIVTLYKKRDSQESVRGDLKNYKMKSNNRSFTS